MNNITIPPTEANGDPSTESTPQSSTSDLIDSFPPQNKQVEHSDSVSLAALLLAEKLSIPVEEAMRREQDLVDKVQSGLLRPGKPVQHALVKSIAVGVAFARSQGRDRVSASEMSAYLHALGLIKHKNARAIGDALGRHPGGLNLPTTFGLDKRTKKLKSSGTRYYLISHLSDEAIANLSTLHTSASDGDAQIDLQE